VTERKCYLCDHHVAIECSFSMPLGGLRYVASNFGHDWCTEGDIRYKMTIHNIHYFVVSIYMQACGIFKAGRVAQPVYTT